MDKTYTDWNSFDVEEYVVRNYGGLLDEDRTIIQKTINALTQSGMRIGSLESVADIGAGPNLYPAMLLAPYVSNTGVIHLIEYSQPNRTYLNSVLHGAVGTGKLRGVWDKFESLMETEGAQWSNVLEAVRNKAKVTAGDIYDLPKSKFDAVSSFFVTESITDDFDQFKKAVNSVIEAVKPGGFIVVAHMLASKGWPAGEGTSFPAVSISSGELKQIYSPTANVKIIEISDNPQVREGYHGMALVVGTRLKKS